METKLLISDWLNLRSVLSLYTSFVVDCDTSGGGRKGGLGLFWLEDLSIDVLSNSLHHINVNVEDQARSLNWRFTGIYDWAEQENKYLTWQLMRDLKNEGSDCWICGGDFNEILFGFEKKGGILHDRRRMDDFREAQETCELLDLGYNGSPYTWTNNQTGNQNIQERLDRIFATGSWINSHSVHRVEHLLRKSSDHCPVWLDLEPQIVPNRPQRVFFRLEAMWFKDPTCMEACRSAWDGSIISNSEDLQNRMTACGMSLSGWERNKFGNITKRIRDLRKELKQLQAAYPSVAVIDNIKEVEFLIDDLLEKEEVMWKQRSKALWLMEGDRNSAFFHNTASGRKHRNRIRKISDASGAIKTKHEDIELVFRNYFEELFRSQGNQDMNEALGAIKRCVNSDMNDWLSKPFTEQEIVNALAQMHPLKSPGPDGMPALFFHKCWDFTKRDLVPVLLNILNCGDDPRALNLTHICLIPKKKNTSTPADFRPISLCNVSFKIITKVIANRLKSILPDIGHLNQSAFVPGRQITDNGLLAFEFFHMMKNSKAKKRGKFAFKLDMAKAYDRVEWDFLRAVMLKLGFPLFFVDLVMRCVTSVSFSILINGSPGPYFSPGRGLRQGDPLSPYLFLFCADTLSALLRQAESRNRLHGVQVCRAAPSITHLFFADDSLIFGRATADEIDTVKGLLLTYEKASGQKVNLDKSEISFSKALPDDAQHLLADRMGVRLVEKHGLYLGIPSVIGRNKKEIFQMLEDRVRKKVKDWKRKYLSGAGKAIMIKSVLQAIPTYLMSCFLLPEGVCQRLDSISANFFWSNKEERRGIHWRKWGTLCKNKNQGGLGYRDTACFNRALLAKQAWRLLHNESSLLSRSLKARYYPRTSPTRAMHAYNPSYTWRSIMAGFEVVHLGAIWRVGNGSNIKVGVDKWVPSAPNFTVGDYLTEEAANILVADFIVQDEGAWDEEAVMNYFSTSDTHRILAIPIAKSHLEDILRWHYSKSGFYTVKSGYHVLRQKRELTSDHPNGSADRTSTWQWMWKLPVIPKVQLFLWRCFNASLSTKTNLLSRRVDLDPICVRCGDGLETLEHLLRDCQWSRDFWAFSPLRLAVEVPPISDFCTWVEDVCRSKPNDFQAIFATLLWTNWFARNLLIFQNKVMNFQDCYTLEQKHRLHEEAKMKNRGSKAVVVWKRPAAGKWKINVDAAVKQGVGTGLGMVVRDDRGGVVGCKYRFLSAVSHIDEAEATAAREGVLLAIELQGKDCILETDCQILNNKLLRKSPDFSYLDVLISDIFSLLVGLNSIEFCWVGRSANTIAHQLAHLALSSFSSSLVMGEVPNSICFPSSEASDMN